MTQTDYIFNESKVSYELSNDRYTIFLDDNAWITQYPPHIPYPELSLEKCCLKQIEEMCISLNENE